MENKNLKAEKIFLVLATITIISGIVLIFHKDYLIGVSGSIVGAGLFWENFKKLRAEK